MNGEQLITILTKIDQVVNEQKDYLNDLDQAIGDGDHGTNVVRGFDEVKAIIPQLSGQPPKKIMKQVAMTLMSKIGGSSGPLLGTLALQISHALPEENATPLSAWTTGLSQGIEAIKTLAKAQIGDKTLLDALAPALVALQAHENEVTAFVQAASAAKKGSDDTIDLEAKKGRASYLGARSIGHIDPGSVTISLIFATISQVMNNG